MLGAHGAQSIAYATAAGAKLATQATSAIVLNAATGLSPQQGATLFAQQVQEARKLGTTLRAAIPKGARAVTMGIDGRLALASVIVQTIGIINGLEAVAKAETNLAAATSDADRTARERELTVANLGYMDSLGGLVAGSLDSMRVAGEAMNLQRGAAAGVVAQTSIHALKFGAQVAGVFGGALNGYVSFLKAEDAREKGRWSEMKFHWAATASFIGTGSTALIGTSLVGAEFIVARQIGSAALQQAAARFVATRVAGVAIGAAVPVVGWVFLGVGIAATVGASILEPTKLEAWARKTPFGNGPADQKFKTLEAQNNALNEALNLAAQPAPTKAEAT